MQFKILCYYTYEYSVTINYKKLSENDVNNKLDNIMYEKYYKNIMTNKLDNNFVFLNYKLHVFVNL